MPVNWNTADVPPYSRYNSAPRTSRYQAVDRSMSLTTRIVVNGMSGVGNSLTPQRYWAAVPEAVDTHSRAESDKVTFYAIGGDGIPVALGETTVGLNPLGLAFVP